MEKQNLIKLGGKNMKKIISLILVLSLLVSSFSSTAFAYYTEEDCNNDAICNVYNGGKLKLKEELYTFISKENANNALKQVKKLWNTASLKELEKVTPKIIISAIAPLIIFTIFACKEGLTENELTKAKELLKNSTSVEQQMEIENHIKSLSKKKKFATKASILSISLVFLLLFVVYPIKLKIATDDAARFNMHSLNALGEKLALWILDKESPLQFNDIIPGDYMIVTKDGSNVKFAFNTSTIQENNFPEHFYKN